MLTPPVAARVCLRRLVLDQMQRARERIRRAIDDMDRIEACVQLQLD